MTPEQQAEARALLRGIRGAPEKMEKARRKLRRFFTSLHPPGSILLVQRGATEIGGRVVSHGEDFDGVHLRTSDLKGHRVTYAELAGMKKRTPRK